MNPAGASGGGSSTGSGSVASDVTGDSFFGPSGTDFQDPSNVVGDPFFDPMFGSQNLGGQTPPGQTPYPQDSTQQPSGPDQPQGQPQQQQQPPSAAGGPRQQQGPLGSFVKQLSSVLSGGQQPKGPSWIQPAGQQGPTRGASAAPPAAAPTPDANQGATGWPAAGGGSVPFMNAISNFLSGGAGRSLPGLAAAAQPQQPPVQPPAQAPEPQLTAPAAAAPAAPAAAAPEPTPQVTSPPPAPAAAPDTGTGPGAAPMQAATGAAPDRQLQAITGEGLGTLAGRAQAMGGVGQSPQANIDFLNQRGAHSTTGAGGQHGPYGGFRTNNDMAARLAAAGRAFERENPGQRAEFGEGDRDAAIQEVYRRRYLMGQGGIAAAPWASQHQYGRAMDIPNGPFADWLKRGNARRFGLDNPVRNDPNHFQPVGQFTPGPQSAAPGGQQFAQAGQPTMTDAGGGGAFDQQRYNKALIAIESGGNPRERTGRNLGLAQFGRTEERQYGINRRNRGDPQAQEAAIQREVADHSNILRRTLGRDPQPWELYLTHQQGRSGGPALLAADPNTPAWQAIRQFHGDKGAIRAIGRNIPSDNILSKFPPEQITVGQFRDMWHQRFNDQMYRSGPQSAADPRQQYGDPGYGIRTLEGERKRRETKVSEADQPFQVAGDVVPIRPGGALMDDEAAQRIIRPGFAIRSMGDQSIKHFGGQHGPALDLMDILQFPGGGPAGKRGDLLDWLLQQSVA